TLLASNERALTDRAGTADNPEHASEFNRVAGVFLPLMNLAGQLARYFFVFRAPEQIMQLVRVGAQIVKFVQVLVPQTQFPAVRRNYRASRFFQCALNVAGPAKFGSFLNLRRFAGRPLNEYVLRRHRFAAKQSRVALASALLVGRFA